MPTKQEILALKLQRRERKKKEYEERKKTNLRRHGKMPKQQPKQDKGGAMKEGGKGGMGGMGDIIGNMSKTKPDTNPPKGLPLPQTGKAKPGGGPGGALRGHFSKKQKPKQDYSHL